MEPGALPGLYILHLLFEMDLMILNCITTLQKTAIREKCILNIAFLFNLYIYLILYWYDDLKTYKRRYP